MKLRLVYYDVLERTESSGEAEVEPGASLSELLRAVGHPNAEVALGRFYPVHDGYSANGSILPFVLSAGRVQWHVSYSETRVADALQTFGLGDQPLRLNVGIPQAGGPNLVDVGVLWERFCDAVRALDPFFGVAGGLGGLLTLLRRVLRRRGASIPPKALSNVPPGAVLSVVVRQPEWDPRELAETTSVTREDAVNLLRLCRYKWDPRSRRYRRTSDTERVVTALNEVQQYDE